MITKAEAEKGARVVLRADAPVKVRGRRTGTVVSKVRQEYGCQVLFDDRKSAEYYSYDFLDLVCE